MKGLKTIAYGSVENAIMVSYREITIYNIHKNDWRDQPVREYLFTLDPYGSEASDDTFNIRDLPRYTPDLTPAGNLVSMISAGIFGEVGSIDKDVNIEAALSKSEACPICGAALTEYEAAEDYDEQVKYPFICSNCGVSGCEWDKLVFDGYTIK